MSTNQPVAWAVWDGRDGVRRYASLEAANAAAARVREEYAAVGLGRRAHLVVQVEPVIAEPAELQYGAARAGLAEEDPAVRAAAAALEYFTQASDYRPPEFYAEIAVAAAGPIIEAEVLERLYATKGD
jgi:hypothetical protein